MFEMDFTTLEKWKNIFWNDLIVFVLSAKY